MRFRALIRRNRFNPANGRHAVSVGIRIGWWPCLHGPFVSLDVITHRVDLWFGLPSYKEH